MRALLFLFCLLFIKSLSVAQNLQYQVELQGYRAGSYHHWVEIDQSVNTFTQLRIQIKTLQDTIQYQQSAHFVESDSGNLQSVNWSNALVDTIQYQIQIIGDSIIYQGSDDTKAHQHTGTLLGPEQIRKLSIELLDTIGAKIRYSTFVLELNKPAEILRELVGYTVEKAQKLKVVKEYLGDNYFSIKKFDRNFNLFESTSDSPYGTVRLTRIQRLRETQFFQSDFFEQSRLEANLLFPDPKQISSIQVSLQGVDSATYFSISQGNQNGIFFRKDAQTLKVTNDLSSLPIPDSLYLYPIAHIWSNSRAKQIVDSLAAEAQDSGSRLDRLATYARTQGLYAAPAFKQLAIIAGFPARLVYGYAYDRWFWSPRFWVEVALDDQWQIIDLHSEISRNAALKIALKRSQPQDRFSDFFLANLPKLTDIRVESFEWLGRRHTVSNQVLRYYFENPVYENEGLGLRFNAPDGFEIADDGSNARTSDFLILKNRNEEKITFSQRLTNSNTSSKIVAESLIKEYLGEPEGTPTFDNKLKLWHSFSGDRGVMAKIQGNSVILIRIAHENPDFIIRSFLRKNMYFKY